MPNDAMTKEVPKTNDRGGIGIVVILSAAVLGAAKDLYCGWCAVGESDVAGARDPSLRMSTRSAQDDRGEGVRTCSAQDEIEGFVDHWGLELLWTLEIGHWSFRPQRGDA